MNINDNMKLGLITAFSVIALFVLSLLITQAPASDDNAVRFGVLTLLPPLVAIILAFITKETILSLFIGVFVGEFMVSVNNLNIIESAINAFLALGNQVIGCMADPWNAGIVLQCLLIGGIIQLVTKMGGAKALADALAKRADTPKKAQLITWFLGLCVFFDDYANSLIVGPIMRPVMDKLKVSRQKLAFVVDATAAPVAGIAIISTWIGLEISLIAEGFKSIGMNVSGFGIFLQTIPFRFYNILILIFIVISALTLYEFGPMKKAEQEARKRKDSECNHSNRYFNHRCSYRILLERLHHHLRWGRSSTYRYHEIFTIIIQWYIYSFIPIRRICCFVPSSIARFNRSYCNGCSSKNHECRTSYR